MSKKLQLLVFAAALAVLVTGCHAGRGQSRMDVLFQDLESDDPDLKGPALCPLHKVPTQYEEVPVVSGMCIRDEEYKRAKVLHFPYSYFEAPSCACDMELFPVPRFVCPICRRNELRWRLANGRSIVRPVGRQTHDPAKVTARPSRSGDAANSAEVQ